MENTRKSKAFIITFILILLLLVGGYYLFKNRMQIFGTKGSTSISKIFSPLLGSSKNKNVGIIDETPNSKKIGITTIDINGSKVVQAEAGENIKKGDAVYISGFNPQGQPIVMRAIANDKNKSFVFGVAGEDIIKGAMGNIVVDGRVIGIKTNFIEGTAWTVGNPLYLSDKILGGMTKNPPVSPSFSVPIGVVFKVDPTNGEIYVGNLAKLIKVDANGNKIVQAEAGENIKKGDAVYISGFNPQGQPIVMRAIANDKNKSLVFGVAGEDILKGNMGTIIIDGDVTGINTKRKEGTNWAINNQLYLSDKILGGLTKNAPKAPSYKIEIGKVTKVDLNNGIINLGSLSNSNTWKSTFGNDMYYQVSNGKGDFGKILNTQLLKDFSLDFGEFWNSIFGNDSYKGGIDFGDIPGFDFSGFDNGGFTYNPITPPTSGKYIYVCNNNYDDDGDGKIDQADPQCHIGGDLNKLYVPNHFSENINAAVNNGDTNGTNNICNGNGADNPPACNKKGDQCLDPSMALPDCKNKKDIDPTTSCKIIEEEPLVFTNEQQQQLSELLRKYYLIAMTLKKEQDIAASYDQIAEYKKLMEQVEGLTRECYSEFNNVKYTGPKERYGNPWFNYNLRGSYAPVKMESKCKYNDAGGDYTVPFCEPSVTNEDASTRPEKYNFWKIPAFETSVDTKDFETLLNIW